MLSTSRSRLPLAGNWHVAGVSRPRHYPVMRVAWIEMPTRRLKLGRLALARCMDVEGVLAPGTPESESCSSTPTGVCVNV